MDLKGVSIIIPCREIDRFALECIAGCSALEYELFEIILLPDEDITEGDCLPCRIIPTGSVSASAKRNIGMGSAVYSIFAFIDSDAYPRRDWLKNAVKELDGENVGMVGGPNLTPHDDDLMRQVAGDVLAMGVASGGMSVRYRQGSRAFMDMLPSCNLVAGAEVFKNRNRIWDEDLRTAEDARLCFEVVEAGKKILYSPDVVVFHHRRALFFPYLEQIWNYGRDTALLLKKRRKIDRPFNLIPPVFIIWLLTGPAFYVAGHGYRHFFLFYLSTIVLYLFTILAGSLIRNPGRAFLIFPTVILTHISYASGFWRGLFLSGNS